MQTTFLRILDLQALIGAISEVSATLPSFLSAQNFKFVVSSRLSVKITMSARKKLRHKAC